MLTVQEIQAMSFEKAVFGGYDMKGVDEFVEKITETIAALQKENAALKSKMKVLVDKIEEYRSVEDGMRRALVSAQNIAQETLEKSKTEAEQLLTTARTEAETRIENYRIQIANESKRLEEAKAKNAEFVAQLSAVYEEQLKSLVALSASDILVEEQAAAYPTEPINLNTEPINIDGKTYYFTCVSMGNPHCVIFVDSIDDIDISKIGSYIENNSIFPNRTNVEFVEIINRGEVKQRTWERGSGETLACGTGASAVCVAGFISGRTDNVILNHLLGGDLVLRYENDTVFMKGEARYCFNGTVKI